MTAQATDTSSSEEEIDCTYYSFTECGSDFEYEGKAGYTCEPEYSKEDLTFIQLRRQHGNSDCVCVGFWITKSQCFEKFHAISSSWSVTNIAKKITQTDIKLFFR